MNNVHLFSRLVAWSAVPIYVLGMAATWWVESRFQRPGEEGGLELAALLIGFGSVTAMGALLVAKRPRNPIGWLLVAAGLMIGILVPADAYTAYVVSTGLPIDGLAVAGAWFQSWYWYLLLACLFIFLPLLFPDGRLPSPKFRFLAIALGFFTLATVVVASFSETLVGNGYSIPNPIGITGLRHVEDIPVWGAASAIYLVGVVAAILGLVIRYRRSRGTERQQLKWLLFAISIFAIGAIAEVFAPVLSSLTFALAVVGLPVAIAVAVLKFRLYEIDRIISRTVTFGLLVLVLGAIYIGGVFVVQAVLPTGSSDLAVAGSTLAVAAAFSPIRKRLQISVERRFNRSRYLAEQVVGNFGDRLRSSFDVGEVASDLQTVISRTLAPSTTGLWLRNR